MCNSQPPKQFAQGRPLGMGAGVTTQPATVYASAANPSLTEANLPPGTKPAAPAAPGVPGAGTTNLGQGTAPQNNPFLTALMQAGMV